MTTAKKLHRIATNIEAHIRFQSTGQLPQVIRPQGPLVDLLKKISSRDRTTIEGLEINESLGYMGSRFFRSAESCKLILFIYS